MSFDVSGKTVLITGAGRGIGRGIARVFARNGARVAVNGLTETYVGPLVEELGQCGGEALAYVGDLTDSSQVDRMVQIVNERFGFIDVLINNLGDAIRGAVVGDADEEMLSDESWASVVDINLTHAFYCSRAVGKQMLDEGRGKVINISSSSAHSGGEGLVAYTAAKTGPGGVDKSAGSGVGAPGSGERDCPRLVPRCRDDDRRGVTGESAAGERPDSSGQSGAG